MSESHLIAGVRHRRPEQRIPPMSCDCHVHVFGAQTRFPMSKDRTYTPAEASASSLAAHQDVLGLDRVVIIQPSIYGIDNRCTLDAIRVIGSGARGIAVLGRDVTNDELETIAQGGIVGLRLNLAAAAVTDLDQARRELDWAFLIADRVGWHVQIFTELSVIAALADSLARAPCPVVVDHFGRADASRGPRQAGLDALLELVTSGAVYVKLSAPYLISSLPRHDDVASLVSAFVAANPDRLLWGSNWPHPGGGTGSIDRNATTPFRNIDDGTALDRFAQWASDDAALEKILVDNPARLFGFTDDNGV